MTQTVTNPRVQMGSDRRTGTSGARPGSAFQLVRGCSPLSTVFSSKSPGGGGGREEGRRRGGELTGGGGGVVKTVRSVSPASSLVGEGQRGQHGKCSAGRSTPSVRRWRSWEGNGLQVPACNAGSSRSRGNGGSRPTSVTER